MTDIKPRDMSCFNRVAKVIGEQRAELELGQVITASDEHGPYKSSGRCLATFFKKLTHGISPGAPLNNAFWWANSPQGEGFWLAIFEGRDPEVNP